VVRSYACLDHHEGRGAHQRRSVFQLPDTGVFYHASQHDGVALNESWVVGDTTLDLAGGERAGCKVAAVRSGKGLRDAELEVEPGLWGERLCDVVDALAIALRRAAG
jgi:phosphoglycolate phosphatase-like HAD superfamily hydrolase